MGLFLDEAEDLSNQIILWDTVITLVSILEGALVVLIIVYAVRSRGNRLDQAFVSLGTLQGLKGLSYNQICARAGAPNAISSIVSKDGTPLKVCQWIASSYHIVLLFDANDVCLGVNSEISV
jgi:hypothetical protein